MSEVAVRARSLSKVYTLYPSPWDRMREVLGLRRRRGASFPEHVAVDGIDLDIRPGEKVGFIGRNGAGKSTLLKLITGVIAPTSGQLEIHGETHALLQMGAGFHQEFTGRQNAYGYLANLGISGADADRAIDEIIAFSELEEYIDQPLKTYSTGMQMRLIFAASTAIAPKLFVIDEVLGVGDAYFQHKSFSRLQELCEKNRTTLLLVSHDIYTAAKLCGRMIWIDRGRIKFDGEPKTALNLYESSIKEQEEQRLRKKAMLLPASLARASGAGRRVVLAELAPASGQLAGSVEIVAARLVAECGELARLADTPPKPDTEAGAGEALVAVDEGSGWRREHAPDARPRLVLSDHGSVFQKGLFRALVPAAAGDARLELELASAVPQRLVAIVYDDRQRPHLAGEVDLAGADAQQACSIPLGVSGLPEHVVDPAIGATARHGSGGIRFTSIDILDEAGRSTRQLRQGEACSLTFDYVLTTPALADGLELNIAIFRDGVLDCMRAFNPALRLPPGASRGTIRYRIPSLPLANGNYALSALIAKRGYYASQVGRPFSLNSDVCDVLSRTLEFVVQERHAAFRGTIVSSDGSWQVTAARPASGEQLSQALTARRTQAELER